MKDAPEYRYEKHPLYGQVRLQRHTTTGEDGRTCTWWEYDPSYQPPIPRHAIPGETVKQVFCALHHVPKYYYVDEQRRCVECGTTFVFSAAEQKYWYETLKFNFHSTAIRCPKCRKRRRTTNGLSTQLTAAREAVAADPESPTAYLELAEALVRLYQRTGHGRLSDAVAAARKARMLWQECVEADFWEGIAHYLAGRDVRAGPLLHRFINDTSARALRRQALVREAEQLLEGMA
jgi:hypothetical protein